MTDSRTYQALVEALAQEGCPVCRLSLEEVHKYFDALLYEDVNDEQVRTELRQGRAFCHDHGWQLLAMQDILGTAIIYREVVLALMADLRREKFGGSGFRLGGLRLPSPGKKNTPVMATRLPDETNCPACQKQESTADRLCTILATEITPPSRLAQTTPVSSIVDPATPPPRARAGVRPRDPSVPPVDLSQAYQLSRDGLCAVHLLTTVHRCKDEATFNWLLARQIERLASLETLMAEIARKSDYRFRDESWDQERIALPRILEAILGAQKFV